MKKRILSILAVIGLLVVLTIPFATPVSATLTPPAVTSVVPADGTGPNGHPGQTLTEVVINGSGFIDGSSVNTVTFDDSSFITTRDVVGSGGGTILTLTIGIRGLTTLGDKPFTIANSNGSTHFTGKFDIEAHVPVYPEPSDAKTEAVGVSITPFMGGTIQNIDGVDYTIGGTAVSGQVHVGDKLTYHVTLSMPPLSESEGYNFFGGTMAVRLPNSQTIYHLVAGPPSTAPMPVIPEITKYDLMNFTLPASLDYIVDASNLVDDGFGHMRLIAHVDYGTPDFPAVNGGVSGTFEETSGIVGAHAGSINALDLFGSLQVNKVVHLNGAGPGGITQTFHVTVTGPSGTFTHDFHLIDGVMTPSTDTPWDLNELISGNYTVTESNPGANWAVSGGGSVSVNQTVSGNTTVTNNFVVRPHTQVQNMTADPNTVSDVGGDVLITVTDLNDGNVPITGATFYLTGNPALSPTPVTMTHSASDPGDNNPHNGILDPGETWTFTATVHIDGATAFTATGHGFFGNTDVTGLSETGAITVSTPPPIPASSNLSLGLLIVGFAGAITFFGFQRRRRSQQSR
jgi:hypothetical protein